MNFRLDSMEGMRSLNTQGVGADVANYTSIVPVRQVNTDFNDPSPLDWSVDDMTNYMGPLGVVFVEELPLTASSKV